MVQMLPQGGIFMLVMQGAEFTVVWSLLYNIILSWQLPSVNLPKPFTHLLQFNRMLIAANDNVPTIEERIIELKSEHRDLDAAIGALTAEPQYDQLQLRRLKKRKLLLKDQISFLESQLIPDIPA